MNKNNFNQAEHYEKDSSIQREGGHKIIDLLAPKKGMKILDLGCGTGYFSKFLADLVGPDGQVVGEWILMGNASKWPGTKTQQAT